MRVERQLWGLEVGNSKLETRNWKSEIRNQKSENIQQKSGKEGNLARRDVRVRGGLNGCDGQQASLLGRREPTPSSNQPKYFSSELHAITVHWIIVNGFSWLQTVPGQTRTHRNDLCLLFK